MEKKNFFGTTLGLAVSALVIFGTVWVVSKAWKKGQQ